MCINHYEYAKGPSRITHTTPSQQPSDSMVEDINYDDNVISTYTPTPQQYGFLDYLGAIVTVAKRWEDRTTATTSSKDEIQTFTTTIFTPGIDTRPQGLAVKGVADNLLGATGAVLGGTAGLLTGRPALVYTGVKLGDAAGRAVGEVMYSAAHWWWDPDPFAASDRTNRQAKELGFGLAY